MSTPSLHIDFEHDFQHKLMQQRFAAGSVLHDADAVRAWRQQWMAQLSSWHTPYKALIDCQHLTLSDDAQLKEALETLLTFMQKLFLRKAVGFNRRATVITSCCRLRCWRRRRRHGKNLVCARRHDRGAMTCAVR